MYRTAKLAGLATERMAVLAVGGLIVALFVILALWFAHERGQIREAGFRNGSNLAHVLQEQIAGSVSAIDLTLQHVADTLRLLPNLPDHDPAFQDALRQNLPRLPFIRALFVVGPDGFITHDTDHPLTPRLSLADRDYFKAHVDDPSRGLFIGPPLLSRSTGTWFVSLSRRLTRPDGSFGGVAASALEVDRFNAFYSQLRMGPQDAIALFLRDGTLLLRVPAANAPIGQPMRTIRPFRGPVPMGAEGSFRTEAAMDQVTRLVSYRALHDFPLVVSVALSEDALLASWRRNAAIATAAALVFAVALAALTVTLIRLRRRLEHARERQLQVQRLETLGRMTGGIAHDVNNVLAVIASGARLLKRSDVVDREVLSRIVDAVAQGNALMSQLLSFAKSQRLDVQTVDIADRIERLEPMMRQAAGAVIDISIGLPAGLGPCRADPTQFDAAILNLIVNARDAMPPGGGRITITARDLPRAGRDAGFSVPPGPYVEVCVADTGAGMAPETARNAPEPFFSTKGETGTGLGLTQVYGFMRQIGGDMKIESKLGKGTSVYLLFPRADAAAPIAAPAEGPEKVASPAREAGPAMMD